MYNGGKILTGLIIFLAILLFPFWYNLGKAAYKPEPELPKPEVAKACVEPKAFMRAEHMQMLNDWRDSVVRDGNRIYVSQNGTQKFQMSLTNTCMKCHPDKKKFCDACHVPLSVAPYCWDCHVDPTPKGKSS